MTGRDLIQWIEEHRAEDLEVYVEGSEDLGSVPAGDVWIETSKWYHGTTDSGEEKTVMVVGV